MFVIVQCLNNVKRSNCDQSRTVSQIISQTMRHAGVSITVTSVTDITAFGVGYFTVSNMASTEPSTGCCPPSEHARPPVLLYLRLHRPRLHLPSAVLVVCGVAGAG